jgi:hypothetical protein
VRCTVFLVSKFRCYFQREIYKIKDNVVRAYSDSITVNDVNALSKFDLGADMRQWKREEDINCQIVNNRINVMCDCCKKFWNKTELKKHLKQPVIVPQ